MSELTKIVPVIAKKYFENRRINILEAGCANGHDTSIFSQLIPESTIYAFEPDVRFHDKMQALCNTNLNINFDKRALASYDGLSNFYVSTRYDEYGRSEVWGSSSVLKPKDHLDIHPQIKFDDEPTRVPCVSLKTWMQESNVKHFDLIWLDLQGSEFDVISASPDCVKDCTFIYSEVHLVENYEGNKLYTDLKSLLEGLGFVPFIEELAWADGGNVLFVNQKFSDTANKIVRELMLT